MADVSIPEKTLEHWASMYATYRFKSNAHLWWTAAGRDITINSLPQVPGKMFWLEMKTATWMGHYHRVSIDLAQLDAYVNGQGAFQVPVYYVFPKPPWTGVLSEQPATQEIRPWDKSELAFQRARDWWFGNWMYVIPAADLYAAFQPDIQALGRGGGKVSRVLGSNPGGPWTYVTAPAVLQAAELGWQEFWDEMIACRLPGAFLAPADSAPSRSALTRAMAEASSAARERRLKTGVDLRVFSPTSLIDGDAAYALLGEESLTEPSAHALANQVREFVFLGAPGLDPV